MIQILTDFITPDMEEEILSHLKPSKIRAGDQRNTIIRYGSSLPYKAKIRSKEIPSYFQPIINSLISLGYPTDSVTVNEYLPGQSIDWHIDSPSSGPTILVLSLESLAQMGLKYNEIDENENNIFKNITYDLPPLSLLILTEEHREKWKHCIYPVSSHRYSIVFRNGIDIQPR